MSFCRITGKSRNLPKPNFFPIIPPISPADSRKICRITAKRMDHHNYVPLLELGKRPECSKKARKEDSNKTVAHQSKNDFKYVTPVLKKEVMTDKSDAKAFEELQKILKRLKSGLGPEEEGKNYVYLMASTLCGLIVPAEVEEAIRQGEIETVSLSKKCDKAVFKIKGRPTLFVPLKEVDIGLANRPGSLLHDGAGQSSETLAKQKKQADAAAARKRRVGMGTCNKKIFEDLERRADAEAEKDEERPEGKGRRWGRGKRTKEATAYRKKIENFLATYTPEGNMLAYGDWRNAIKVN